MTKPGWKDYLLLQGGVLIYSINTVCAKIASGKPVLSGAFIGWLALVVLMLGIYALIWQQSMKKIELSVGYANKATGLGWALLWSILLFHDTVTPGKICGIALVIGGTLLMNLKGKQT